MNEWGSTRRDQLGSVRRNQYETAFQSLTDGVSESILVLEGSHLRDVRLHFRDGSYSA